MDTLSRTELCMYVCMYREAIVNQSRSFLLWGVTEGVEEGGEKKNRARGLPRLGLRKGAAAGRELPLSCETPSCWDWDWDWGPD